MAETFDIRSNLKRYAIEFVVIFVSVSLSFVADNLRDEAANRKMERAALARLEQDLAADLEAFPGNLDRAQIGLDAIDRLLAPNAADSLSTSQVETQLQRYWLCSVFQANNSEYESLKASGDLKLLRDDALRRRLAENYEAYETLEFYHRDDCDRMPDTFRHIADEIQIREAGYSVRVTVTGNASRILNNAEFRIALAAHKGLRMVLVDYIEQSMSLVEGLQMDLAN